MPVIKTLDDLNKVREDGLRKRNRSKKIIEIIVSLGSCGIASGALKTLKSMKRHIELKNLSGISVSQTGCIGYCSSEPIVQVVFNNKETITYGKVSPRIGLRIINEHILRGNVVKDYVIDI